MAKLLDKKERVYDLKLTGYGKHLLSVGKYKPVYYAFFDDNIIYDGAYANISESQNQIHERIKTETSYIESLVLFEDVNRPQILSRAPQAMATHLDGTDVIASGFINYYISDVTPIQYVPRKDIFKYDLAIGDAVINSQQKDVAPAWKVVVLNGHITSAQEKLKVDPSTASGSFVNIPQVNVRVEYQKQIKSIAHQATDPMINDVDGVVNSTALFTGNEYITLTKQDPVVYVEEVNTSLLTENFDVEVFLVTSSLDTEGNERRSMERKYFQSEEPQIIDGIMTRASPETANSATNSSVPRTAVEYFFDFRKDSKVDPSIVCKQLQIYNKSSYYIDMDIDCSGQDQKDIYNDIYGSEVEPEICLD